MSEPDTDFETACGEITRNLLLAGSPPSEGAVRAEIKRACARHSLDRIPRNHEILSMVSGQDYARLRTVLVKKPAKTASGVAVVALMPKPFACPHGRCTYCPGGVESGTPNSYTGREPSTINAIENRYDPGAQITSKLDRLVACGHDPAKLELVIVGGTFLFMPQAYRTWFVKSCYDALNGFESATLRDAKAANERARIRNVGFTIETKPDYCKERHIDDMLEYGATRVEIGVQSLQERVYGIVNRGHDLGDVTESFRVAKDAGYKIVAHMMPGLPTVTPEQDIADFGRLFGDERFRPDMLKIYPALVLEGTPLHDEYLAGRYRPYSEEEAVRVLARAKAAVPRWVRIMRIQREISPGEIVAGPRSGNLRQLVHRRMREEGLSCRCIRCREAGLNGGSSGAGGASGMDGLALNRTDYDSSGGREAFLSYDDVCDRVYGFLRLRRPGTTAHRREVSDGSTVVRELHVYGRSLGLGLRDRGGIQHMGLGRRLVAEAERISREEFDADRMLVISAVGTREYYRRLGYRPDGPYMVKRLV